MVSVSRRAGLPHVGQVVFTKAGTLASGGSPVPVMMASGGSVTGRSASGTPTAPWSGQYTMGMGVPSIAGG